jgi:hypothetical protein
MVTGLTLATTDAQRTELLEAKAQTSAVISSENRSGNVDPARAREAMKDPEIQVTLHSSIIISTRFILIIIIVTND